MIQRSRFVSDEMKDKYLILLKNSREKTQLGSFNEAEEFCTDAIKINPYYSTGYAERGSLRTYMHKYDDANQDYAKAIMLTNPKNGFSVNQVYSLWLQLGAHINENLFHSAIKQSIDNSNKETSPNNITFTSVPSWVLKGYKINAYLFFNRYEQAASIAQTMTTSLDENIKSMGFLKLATLFAQQGKTKESCEYSKKITSSNLITYAGIKNFCSQ
jgi:tetratricopeptide (TPR) repeat protein